MVNKIVFYSMGNGCGFCREFEQDYWDDLVNKCKKKGIICQKIKQSDMTRDELSSIRGFPTIVCYKGNKFGVFSSSPYMAAGKGGRTSNNILDFFDHL